MRPIFTGEPAARLIGPSKDALDSAAVVDDVAPPAAGFELPELLHPAAMTASSATMTATDRPANDRSVRPDSFTSFPPELASAPNVRARTAL
jgi:hypothetical protein